MENSRQSLIPSYLYSSSAASRSLFLHKRNTSSVSSLFHSSSPAAAAASGNEASPKSFVIPSPSEPGKIQMYSPQFYAVCTAGGILSCGLTHMTVTPLELVKCNMQIDPAKYKSISSGFGVLFKEQGVSGFFRGWVPTLLGYSVQGACKFGFYEFFKKYYSDLAGAENAAKYKTLIYLAGSASAEVIADIALCRLHPLPPRCFDSNMVEILVEVEISDHHYYHLNPLFSSIWRCALTKIWRVSLSHQAIKIISWLAKYKFNPLKKHKLVISILQVMCPLLAEASSREDDDDLADDQAAAEVIDTMALNLPKYVFSRVSEFASLSSESPNPKYREASVIALGVISEGC